MKKKNRLIRFLKKSMTLTNLSKKINLIDKQITELYLQLGLLTYNISQGISNETEKTVVLQNKITSLIQEVSALTREIEKRHLSINKYEHYANCAK